MFYKVLNNTSFYSDFNEQKFAIGGGQSLGRFKPNYAVNKYISKTIKSNIDKYL